MMNIAHITNPGLKYRLNQSVPFLGAIMGRLLAAKSASHGLRWRGRALRMSDGTCVKKPGSTGTDWRVHAVFDLESGGFPHLELTDGKGAPQIIFKVMPTLRDMLRPTSREADVMKIPKPDPTFFTEPWQRVGHEPFSLMI